MAPFTGARRTLRCAAPAQTHRYMMPLMLPAKVIWKPILQRWITGQGKPFRMRPANPMIASGLERIGLYLHVPFCASMCPFCPYNRVPYDEKLFERYRRAVCQEIDACAPSLDGVKIGSLYVGGGTPTVGVWCHRSQCCIVK